MSSSTPASDKFGPSNLEASSDYQVANYEPSQFVEAMAELEERMHHAALLIQCTECGTGIKIGRQDLYFLNAVDSPRRDKAGAICPNCESIQTIPHTDLVQLAGVADDV